MSEYEDISHKFEAVKTSMSQNKDGVILRLAIHPNDVPRHLMVDRVGSRYMVVMVAIGDDETPTANPDLQRANSAIKIAGLLCRNANFQRFLVEQGAAEPSDDPQEAESATVTALREILGVTTRSELRDVPEAVERLYAVRDDFTVWLSDKS